MYKNKIKVKLYDLNKHEVFSQIALTTYLGKPSRWLFFYLK